MAEGLASDESCAVLVRVSAQGHEDSYCLAVFPLGGGRQLRLL